MNEQANEEDGLTPFDRAMAAVWLAETKRDFLAAKAAVERIIAARVASERVRLAGEVRALYDNGDGGVFVTGTKIVRVTQRRRDLGCDVTESMLRVSDVKAIIDRALVPAPGVRLTEEE